MELTQDAGFIKEIRDKYEISAKAYEYLVKECASFYDRNESTKEKRKDKIKENQKLLKKEPNPKKRVKINKKIINLTRSLKKGVVFGGKSFLQTKTERCRKIFRENRILPLCFYGEAARNGNRFFDLEGLSDGQVLFKYEGSKIKINLELSIKKSDVLLLKQIELLAMAKLCPVTVKLTSERIYITYDEAMLNGNKFDEKALYKSIKHITGKDERKVLIHQAYMEFEQRMLAKKDKTRFLSLDMNPDGIGYSILQKTSDSPDGEFIVLQKEFINFSRLNKQSTNKRKYELSIAIKYMFNQLSHFNCAYLVTEELSDISNKDNGNKVSNRKINNLWNRNYIDNLLTKYSNIRGIKQIKINPVYSSFIGNINYESFDPVASSIEIGRRGIIKYIRGAKMIPEFCMSNILNGLGTKLPKKIYEDIHECKTWKELFKAFSTAKTSVRRKANNFAFSEKYLKNKKSTVNILRFL